MPTPRIGALLVLGAAVYYLKYLRSTDGLLFAIGFCLAYAWAGVAAHILMTWPTGRLKGPVDRIYVAASYVTSIGTQVARYFVDDTTPPWGSASRSRSHSGARSAARWAPSWRSARSASCCGGG